MEKKKSGKSKIKEELEECQKIKEEYLANWKRERADFLNYKKGETERMEEFLKYVNVNLILKILPILDNIYIAEKKIPEELKNNQWIEGFLKIKNQFEDFLKERGIEEIKSLGKKFDPNFHEAVETAETKGKESGIIVDEIKKGYKIKDKVLRPARVRVSK